MKAILVCDSEIKTENSEALKKSLMELFLQRNIEVKLFEINRNNVKNCIGCFGCWIKTPGECVIYDLTKEERDTFITLTSGKYNKSFDKVLLSVSDKDNEDIINQIG